MLERRTDKTGPSPVKSAVFELDLRNPEDMEKAAKIFEKYSGQLHKPYTLKDLELFNIEGNARIFVAVEQGKDVGACLVLGGDFAVPQEEDGSPNAEYREYIEKEDKTSGGHFVRWEKLDNGKEDRCIEFFVGESEEVRANLVKQAIDGNDYVYFEQAANDNVAGSIVHSCGFKRNDDYDELPDWLYWEYEA